MLYDRHCLKCDEIFEVSCKISEKDNEHHCPYCDATEGEWMISSPNLIGRSERLMGHNRDTGFKEVLQKIGERNKRTPVAQRGGY